MQDTLSLVCKIPLLARALGLKAEQSSRQAKRARDVRVSCIQEQRLLDKRPSTKDVRQMGRGWF